MCNHQAHNFSVLVDGCFDGALEKVDELLDWAYESGLTVLLDVSRNGANHRAKSFALAHIE